MACGDDLDRSGCPAGIWDPLAIALAGDTKVVLLAAGLIFLWALALGIVKYRQMATSETHLAHPYIDTAHRAALLYAFASTMLAVFVQFSAWSQTVDLIAAFVLIFFFVAAIFSYMVQGIRAKTDNSFRENPPGLHPFMYALILGEIGGFVVLLAGFVQAQLL